MVRSEREEDRAGGLERDGNLSELMGKDMRNWKDSHAQLF
jgi:hypothetical protein